MSSRRGLLSNAPPSAQRPRNSARPNTASTPSGRTSQPQLPAYEAPVCPLDLTARRALTELSNNATDTRKYTAELANSIKLLGESVAEVNDRYNERKTRLRQRIERHRSEGVEEIDDDTRALQGAVQNLGQEIPEITTQCDEGVRQVIDWGIELEDSRTALRHTVAEVEDESRQAEQRETAAKERTERIQLAREERLEQGMDDEADEAEMEEEAEDEPLQVTGPSARLRDNKRKLRADYEEKSLYQKYGLNNDYINFKRMWHDSAHSIDKKPLPDASRWFVDNASQDDDEDEDVDLIVAGEKKDLRCPLSLVMMEEPYTSAKCNHTFEKTAVVEFLRDKPGRTATCPLTGCNKRVSMKDFSLDQHMLQQIKRSQRQDDEEDNEEDDEDDVDADESMRVTSQRQVKKERRRRGVIEDGEDQDMDEA